MRSPGLNKHFGQRQAFELRKYCCMSLLDTGVFIFKSTDTVTSHWLLKPERGAIGVDFSAVENRLIQVGILNRGG